MHVAIGNGLLRRHRAGRDGSGRMPVDVAIKVMDGSREGCGCKTCDRRRTQ
jgi:hypothetical protein